MTEFTSEFDGLTGRDLKVMEKLLEIKNTRINFAMDHHVNTHGERMNFRDFPHIRALYESVAPEIVVQGSVQSLKSEWVIIDHFAAASSGLSVFFVLPKFDTRNTYVQNRVNKCVENVEEYKKIMGRGFFDSLSLKSFGRGTVKYVGSNVATDFKEFPANMVIVDEIDDCDKKNVEMALDRLKSPTNPFRLIRYLGNPTHKNYGINAKFLQSDQREWEVPCRSCGKFSELDWFKVVVREIVDSEGNLIDFVLQDDEWYEGCGRDVHCVCQRGTKRKCEGILDRKNRGQWKVTAPEFRPEGYHISRLISLINSISELVVSFRKAVHDPAAMQLFFNSDLGLPYSALGNKLTETMLENCTGDYDFEIDPLGYFGQLSENGHSGPCSMGVDVGGHLDVRISYTEGNSRKAVFIGKVTTLEDLYDLIARYNVERCVMDSMPEAMMAQEFQETAQCDVWLCSYRSGDRGKRLSYDLTVRSVNADRTDALDRSFAQFKRKKNILPRNYNAVNDYVEEMTNSVREIVETKSGQKYDWVKCKDHSFHADSYDLIASNMLMGAVLDEVIIG